LIALSKVFTETGTTVTQSNWTPTISEDAAKGTYRLEFTYGDKTDYLDFIVQ
jgi:hypothetical protein